MEAVLRDEAVFLDQAVLENAAVHGGEAVLGHKAFCGAGSVTRPGLREQLKGLAKNLSAQRAESEAAARARQLNEARALRETNVFRDATRDVTPLPAPPGRGQRSSQTNTPPPLLPLMHWRDEKEALAASLSDGVDAESLLDTDEALSFLREGIAPNTLKKLRRGDWAVQSHLDLHGMTRDAARDAVAAYLRDGQQHGLRCVRIVHGKGLGSKNREPVLKVKLRGWLMQSDAVLAYVQARAADGGAGAVLVLLNGVTV